MTNIPLLDQPNQCEYCKKKFMSAKTLIGHMCERKRRSMQKDEKRVKMGMLVFNRFYYLTTPNSKPKTYDDFCKTSYYNAFVKFGSYITNIRAIHPEKFIDYVIKSGKKLDKWCSDALYDQYMFDMLKQEPIDSAIQRSFETMIEWADANNSTFNHYFLYASYNRAAQDIRNGRISPWLLLNCSSGQTMLQRFSDDQLNTIAPAFDLPFWLKKFKTSPADVALVKDTCKQAHIP